ncbi:hypothetical protein FUAX_51690 (plasmid) [Fulvitalea axinellae]|uniref:Uncharacterized protein n=1 Tax=Fulvitalea axinellae TaxID=1182444 RepID=A0AAU9D0Q4_9BACT|nr:hypothetical protein FUAX_51690 [Fulvitalea axinellae]
MTSVKPVTDTVYTVQQYRQATGLWNGLRHSPKAVTRYLSQGNHFVIPKKDWEKKWKGTNSEYMHIYFGIDGREDRLKFIVVDSNNDKRDACDGSEANHIGVYDYDNFTAYNELPMAGPRLADLDNELTFRQAVTRNLVWQMMMPVWVQEKCAEHSPDGHQGFNCGIYRIFKVPFADFADIFETEDNRIIATFGLKKIDPEASHDTDYEGELIFWGKNKKVLESVGGGSPQEEDPITDLTKPIPPFGSEEEINSFNLIDNPLLP